MNNVLSTKAKVFRNLKEYKFCNKLTKEKQQELLDKVVAITKKDFSLLDLNTCSETIYEWLKENGFETQNNKILIDKNQKILIDLFNGEHLTINGCEIGYDKQTILKTQQLANELADKINFAYLDDYGFLMSDINKIGTGFRLEADIDLGSIKNLLKIEQVKQNVKNLGYILNEKSGNTYTLKTGNNLGFTSSQIIDEFEKMLSKLQDLETESAKLIDASKHEEIIDKIERNFAILSSANLLDYQEFEAYLSTLRLSLNLNINKVSLKQIKQLQMLLNTKKDIQSITETKNLAIKVKNILKGE